MSRLGVGRKAVLSRPVPPELLMIIDEAALRRPVGDRAVMAEQIRHIAKAAERSNIVVQVLPLDLGAHPGVNGSFVMLEFAKARTIVHLETSARHSFSMSPTT